MTINSGNDYLKDATWYYFTSNGDDEMTPGNWWYYENGEIIEKVV